MRDHQNGNYLLYLKFIILWTFYDRLKLLHLSWLTLLLHTLLHIINLISRTFISYLLYSIAFTLFRFAVRFKTFFLSHFITFLYSSIFYVRRKYWHQENFRLLIFDRFTRVMMSWTWFHYFYKKSVCLCVWHKFCGHDSAKTDQQNLVKFYI